MNFVSKEEECPATGPAGSDHARIALAEKVRKDFAHLHAAQKGSHDILSRRFDVHLKIPTSARIEAIGPREKDTA